MRNSTLLNGDSSMTSVIELEQLSVTFGKRPILKSLNGALNGRAIGLLGPNGAGKTTLIHTLLGFHPPTSGTARIFGQDITTRRQAGAGGRRLHAGERFVYRQNVVRSLRASDGGAVRHSRRVTRSNARTKLSFTSAWAKRVIVPSIVIRSA